MLKKYSVQVGLLTSLVLLVVATTRYPGGSQADVHSIGFRWQHNYVCDLLSPVAVNAMDNPAQAWAVAGLLVLAGSVALFFRRFAAKIPQRGAANVIQFAGCGAMGFAVLAATPWHDLGVALSGTLLMLSMFYCTVFVLRSRLRLLKVLSVASLLSLYVCTYVYYSRMGMAHLPVLQKVNLALSVGWVVGLEQFAKASDFAIRAQNEVASA